MAVKWHGGWGGVRWPSWSPSATDLDEGTGLSGRSSPAMTPIGGVVARRPNPCVLMTQQHGTRPCDLCSLMLALKAATIAVLARCVGMSDEGRRRRGS